MLLGIRSSIAKNRGEKVIDKSQTQRLGPKHWLSHVNRMALLCINLVWTQPVASSGHTSYGYSRGLPEHVKREYLAPPGVRYTRLTDSITQARVCRHRAYLKVKG